MNRLRLLLLCVLFLLGACASAPAPKPDAQRNPLILISIDGLRADYLDRGQTPTLAAIAVRGVRAEFMRPSFPSLTFPNHYTLITGLRPDRNGIVANQMEDERIPGQRFTSSNSQAIGNRSWWDQGIPLWTTAKQQGLRSGTMFWPGSEAPVHGAHPDYWAPFDASASSENRVDTLLGWFDLPPAKRPSLFTLYLDNVDVAGHRAGPESPEVDIALQTVDAAIARLLTGIEQRGLRASINLVIVSDHGMTSTSPSRVIYLDDLISPETGRAISFGALSGIVPAPEHREAVEARLLAPHEHMRCWRKSELPARFHYGRNRRIPPLLCLANPGWVIFDRATLAAKKYFSLGEHGYDNDSPEMRAIFIANGPAFRSGIVTAPFDNVDVYPLLAHLLAIKPAANDGNPATMTPMLSNDKR